MKFLKRRRISNASRVSRPSAAIEAWLERRGCRWSKRVRYTNVGTAAGYGLVATADIAKGALLFVAPRRAAFGAGGAEAGDTQRELAAAMLRERYRYGRSSRWAPFLATLTPAPCPWTWSKEDRALLDGTELEAVVALKRSRLETERRAAADDVGVAVSAAAYGRALRYDEALSTLRTIEPLTPSLPSQVRRKKRLLFHVCPELVWAAHRCFTCEKLSTNGNNGAVLPAWIMSITV